MKIKERTLKGWFSIAYFLLFLGLLLSGIRMHKNILSLLSFSCLGLSVRALFFVYRRWNDEKELKDKIARGCIVSYLFHYPLLICIVFILASALNSKYNIATFNPLLLNILSFYVGFDIVKVADRFN